MIDAEKSSIRKSLMISATIPIHVSVQGSGTPCFFLHGGPGMDSSYFFPYLEPLTKIFQCHLIDLRGCGRAPRLDRSEYTVEKMLQDIEAYRKQCGSKKIVLLGHSFGAVLAMEYALAFPQNVQALILVATAARSDFLRDTTRNSKQFPDVMQAQRSYALSARKDADFAALVFGSIPLYFAPGFEASAEIMLKKIHYGADCYAAVSQNILNNYSLLSQLHEIKASTLVLGAGADLVTPPEYNREIAERLPHAVYHEVAGAGHFPFFEAPDECCKIIEEWWENI